MYINRSDQYNWKITASPSSLFTCHGITDEMSWNELDGYSGGYQHVTIESSSNSVFERRVGSGLVQTLSSVPWPRIWTRDNREQIQQVARSGLESRTAGLRARRADHSVMLFFVVYWLLIIGYVWLSGWSKIVRKDITCLSCFPTDW